MRGSGLPQPPGATGGGAAFGGGLVTMDAGFGGLAIRGSGLPQLPGGGPDGPLTFSFSGALSFVLGLAGISGAGLDHDPAPCVSLNISESLRCFESEPGFALGVC